MLAEQQGLLALAEMRSLAGKAEAAPSAAIHLRPCKRGTVAEEALAVRHLLLQQVEVARGLRALVATLLVTPPGQQEVTGE